MTMKVPPFLSLLAMKHYPLRNPRVSAVVTDAGFGPVAGAEVKLGGPSGALFLLGRLN